MKRIAVYCGASKGKDPIYVKEAEMNFARLYWPEVL